MVELGIIRALETRGVGRSASQRLMLRLAASVLAVGSSVGFLVGTTSNPTLLEFVLHLAIPGILTNLGANGLGLRFDRAGLRREREEGQIQLASLEAQLSEATQKATDAEVKYARLETGVLMAGHKLSEFVQDGELYLAEARKFQRLLGEGGMAKALLVWAENMETMVVWKVPQLDLLGNIEGLERFIAEAKAMVRVNHPGVVRFFSLGKITKSVYLDMLRICDPETFQRCRRAPQLVPEEVPYIEMEYVEGKTLTHHVESYPGKRLPIDEALNYAYNMGETLSEVFRSNIIHRDMKPDNVFIISHNGDPVTTKIVDFGLARQAVFTGAGPVERLTKVGTVMGTPQYMAPEQARGAPMDWRVDQYALGVILYEMITGKLPIDDTRFMNGEETANDYLVRVLTEKPVPISSWPELRVPNNVTVAVHRMLGKEPESRFPNWHECLVALYDAIQTYSVTKGTPTRAATPGLRSR